jgi:putative redox protein
MMEAKVTWQEGMHFLGSADSGYQISMDASPNHGGEGDGASPMELFAIGMAGCTGMDVVSILRKKKQDFSKFEMKVSVNRSSEHPKVFEGILIEYIVNGHTLDPKAVERSVELSVERYCSGIAMLSKSAEIKTKVTILEAE